MKNEGRTLSDLLNVSNDNNTEQKKALSVDTHINRKSAQKVPTRPLNVDIPESLMRDLKVISAHNDVTIKELVVTELTKLTKREKRKIIDELNQ